MMLFLLSNLIPNHHMLKILGRIVYKLFNIEVRFKGNWRRDYKWLIDKKFQTIIDIGANEGQFALRMRKLFPNAEIVSFEPIPDIYNKLTELFKDDRRFEGFNYGLGDQPEQATFYLNDYSPSSSLLRMSGHDSHFLKAKEAMEIQVEIEQLDTLLSKRKLKKPILVKIDVQGFEDRVIKGGQEILSQADMVFCEVSFTNLYQGQKLFDDIYLAMKALGFSYCGNIEQLISPETSQVLQADAIFTRSQG